VCVCGGGTINTGGTHSQVRYEAEREREMRGGTLTPWKCSKRGVYSVGLTWRNPLSALRKGSRKLHTHPPHPV